jgi:hypothetical protein
MRERKKERERETGGFTAMREYLMCFLSAY